MEELAKHVQVEHLSSHKAVYFLTVLFVVMLGLGGYGYISFNNKLQTASTTIATLNKNIASLKDENDYVNEKLLAEQNKNNNFQGQIVGLSGTVDSLDKLTKTDKELLQKYSKVYFLNENYVPKNLAPIPVDYVFDKTRVQQMHSEVLPFLKNMIMDASYSGINFKIISAYRSFGEQSTLKTSYKVTYGAGTANKFSADQGYSEHQLGTAIDFTTEKLGANYEKFTTDPGYQWLVDRAYMYGFILSYPENNAYYQFEPWHWRFVGKALAEKMHEDKQHFYDLDQRNIDSYLGTLFDY